MTDFRDPAADGRTRLIDPVTQDPRTGAPLRDPSVGVHTTNNIPVAKSGSSLPWIIGIGAIVVIGALYFMSGETNTVVPDAAAPAATETAPAAPATSTAPAATDTAPATTDTAPAATDTAPDATPAAPAPATTPAPAN